MYFDRELIPSELRKLEVECWASSPRSHIACLHRRKIRLKAKPYLRSDRISYADSHSKRLLVLHAFITSLDNISHDVELDLHF